MYCVPCSGRSVYFRYNGQVRQDVSCDGREGRTHGEGAAEPLQESRACSSNYLVQCRYKKN